ncbi:MAG: UDP binding domain-containing protein [bacterium]
MYNKIDMVDPHASPEELREEYDLELAERENGPYDAIVTAVSHDEYAKLTEAEFLEKAKDDAVVVDVKGNLKGQIQKLDYLSL